MDQSRKNVPDYLWYRLPEEYSEYLNPQSDAFLAASLLGAMHFGEDIEVQGSTSPQLAYNLEEYQYLARFNFPKLLKPVSVKYEQLSTINRKANFVGTSFSGGVDSLFTLKSHLPDFQNNPDYQITHAVFIRGFDILPHESGYYDSLFYQYEKQLINLGIKLIEVETNIVSLTHQRLNFSNFYGPQIVSAALILSGLFQRYFIPSSGDYELLRTASSTANPLMDRLLTNGATQIIHHGSTHTRSEKIEAIADWKTAQKLLWVCLEANSKEATWNCSRCEKCMRTMIPLYSLAKLVNFKTFDKPFTRNWDLIRYSRKYKQTYNFAKEFLPFIQRTNKKLLPWIIITNFMGTFRSLIIKYLPGSIKVFLRRFGYFKPRNDSANAYEVPEVSQLIKKSYDY
ncbi:MAG: hypothetical protein JEZ06_04375 [Anaerolineaceae bacterium]|nr:hypothetical protein [Anaerolineaceae bacterium]